VSSEVTANGDPVTIQCKDSALPDAWPDRPIATFRRILSTLLFGGGAVELPAQLPGRDALPDYLLREFHRVPNGYYSRLLVRGYERGFERAMLGSMDRNRDWLARAVQGRQAVLDIGCGSGKVIGAVAQTGVRDLWGLDASPYQLCIAAADFPEVSFVQGLAENMPFEDARFDAVTACFLFHELPAEMQDAVLLEVRRVLKPGGLLAISEPSPMQLSTANPFTLFRLAGLRGWYFALLARFVTEPYVEQWHARDLRAWAECQGFTVQQDAQGIPFRQLILQLRRGRT